jgi:hypothetical protein
MAEASARSLLMDPKELRKSEASRSETAHAAAIAQQMADIWPDMKRLRPRARGA